MLAVLFLVLAIFFFLEIIADRFSKPKFYDILIKIAFLY